MKRMIEDGEQFESGDMMYNTFRRFVPIPELLVGKECPDEDTQVGSDYIPVYRVVEGAIQADERKRRGRPSNSAVSDKKQGDTPSNLSE